MTDMPRIVEVAFLMPGHSPSRERYDMLDPADRACWHVNAGSCVQISVTPVEWVTIPDDRPRRIAAWHRLVRMRGKVGKKMGLTLRTSSEKRHD